MSILGCAIVGFMLVFQRPRTFLKHMCENPTTQIAKLNINFDKCWSLTKGHNSVIDFDSDMPLFGLGLFGIRISLINLHLFYSLTFCSVTIMQLRIVESIVLLTALVLTKINI